MKLISLTQNKFALIDDEDFEKVNKLKWHFDGRYAARKSGKKSKKLYLHTFILNSKKLIDHLDRNKLNCQKYNLQISNKSKNMFNSKLFSTNTSGYRGVVWDKKRKKWVSQIKINYKNKFLGYFLNKEEAYKTRQQAEIKYFRKYSYA